MNNMVEFSRRLKEEREKAHLTQAQLAKKVGVSSQTISAYEKTGEKGKTPTLDNAASIARVLGVSLDYLIGQSPTAQQQVELKDLSSVVDYLRVLTGYFDCEVGLRTVDLPEEQWEFINYGDGTEEIIKTKQVATFTIDSYGLAQFFEKRNKMYRLVNDGTIPTEMYQTWLCGEIQKLRDKWPLGAPRYKNSDFN